MSYCALLGCQNDGMRSVVGGGFIVIVHALFSLLLWHLMDLMLYYIHINLLPSNYAVTLF